MASYVVYLFPLILDIVVSLTLFVSRHSFAERGLDTGVVGAVSVIYGIVYILASLVMGRIVRPERARLQIQISLGMIAVLLCAAANVTSVFAVLAVFSMVPVGTSLFFNAFQAYMLAVDTGAARPLSRSVGNYTFAWSIGFALGPLVSSWMRHSFSWSAAYYVAAVITLAVWGLILWYRPVTHPGAHTPAAPRHPGKALPVAGWAGILIGLSGWVAVTTYWPVQAQSLGYGPAVKGGVEFVYALAQACGALLMSFWHGWYHRPWVLALPALPGIAGLVLFASAGTPALFMAGAVCYGLYTGSCFIYMVYHSMYDADRAVGRVAVNEFTVGLGFICGPLVAGVLLNGAGSFTNAYGVLAAGVAAGVLVQILAARRSAAATQPCT